MANARLITQVCGAIHDSSQWQNLIKGLSECKYYAYIYHDSDEGKEKHLHFVAEDRHSLAAWSDLLGIPEHMIEITHHFRGANRYLIHLDDKEKFLYNKSAVFTNKPLRFESYLEDNQELSARNLLNDLAKLREGGITRKDFIDKYEYHLNKQSFYSQFKIYSELLKWS